MRHASSTWLSSGLLALALLGAATAAKALCLPPLFEGGRRLHQIDGASLFDLDILLGQHELCWRSARRPDERRILLLGNSAVFGAPLPADQTFWALSNRELEAAGTGAHIYNLGFASTYQLKEALIVHQALRYEPHLIVYGVTLADFGHVAPMPWPPALWSFFAYNTEVVAALASSGAPGLEEPLATYRAFHPRGRRAWALFEKLRQAGAYLRLAARQNAHGLVRAWSVGGEPRASDAEPLLRRGGYRCSETLELFERDFHAWQEWNILAYLERVQQQTGTEVLVVNWPVAHAPIGACYNRRYPSEAQEEYDRWLRSQAESRGLSYLDLHDLVPAEEFPDTLHPSPDGHARIASALVRALRERFPPEPRARVD